MYPCQRLPTFMSKSTILTFFFWQHFPLMSAELSNDQELPLHSAAKEGHCKLVRLLLHHNYIEALDKVQLI